MRRFLFGYGSWHRDHGDLPRNWTSCLFCSTGQPGYSRVSQCEPTALLLDGLKASGHFGSLEGCYGSCFWMLKTGRETIPASDAKNAPHHKRAARSMLQLSRPIQNGVVKDWNEMEATQILTILFWPTAELDVSSVYSKGDDWL